MDRMTAHLDRGWELVSKGDTRRAFIAARRALELNNESPEAHNLMGYIHALDGDIEDALSCYRAAMELDEYYLDPILNAADLLVHPESDPAEAVELCEKAIELSLTDEEKLDAVLLLVEALLNLDRTDEARAKLLAARPAAPVAPMYETLLGRACFEVGLPQEAKRHLQRAVEKEPKAVDAWYYLGLLAREEGQRIEAVCHFTQVHELEAKAPLPPWADRLPPLEVVLRDALALLGPEIRALVEGTQFIVEDRPNTDQIGQEIDPRQVVYLTGVDPVAKRFERLWIFRHNLLRCGTTLPNLIEDLAAMIAREANP